MERGNRIKILRILCGFSQEEVANQLKVSQGNVATWERKDMFPREKEVARKLADTLQATIGYLAYGESVLRCAFWEPQPPLNPRHLNAYLNDIQSLFPELCRENFIDHYVYYAADNGMLFFLGSQETPLSYALLLKPSIVESFLNVLSGFKTTEMKGLESCPPICLGFIEDQTIDSFAVYYRFAKSTGFDVDTEAINTAFLKIKKLRGVRPADAESLRRNAFMHYHAVLRELEEPIHWKPQTLDPRYPTLDDNLSLLFERVYVNVTERAIVWNGDIDKDLADMIRDFLKWQGFKEKVR